MDFILENEGKPVPDLSAVSSSSQAAPSGGGGDAVDEDEDDAEALRAVYGTGAAGQAAAAADVEAKVRFHCQYARIQPSIVILLM